MSKKAIVSILECMGALALSRYLNRYSPLILMYHRVLKHELIPGTHPDVFAEQIAYIKKHFNVINMSQLLMHLEQGNLPERVLVLTFDDGHYDFYTNAWPVIKQHGLTATLFVTTNFIDQQTWLWPDLLRYLLMNANPRELSIEGLGTIAINTTNILATWNKLGDFCLELSSEDRNVFIKNMASRLEISIPDNPQAPFAPTTWPQLTEMVNEGLDVGSHSVTHPILSKIKPDQLLTELTASKARIREMLNIDAIGICYPNGMPVDVSPEVQNEASKHYRYGVVAYPKKFNPQELMRIGRIGATNDLTKFKVKTSHLSRAENIGEYK
mgnify:CR=1 FL=1